ncbi:MAG: transporter substrate-binding domain-containing protein [Desulfobacter sp.]|nr:MAG: transporter substrate-binding domain-containing protein [Desulfobacter sp.]
MRSAILFFAFLFLLLPAAAGAVNQSTATDLLTAEERAWLNRHNGKITIAPDPNDPPLDFFDNLGAHRGLTADYIRLIEKKLGARFKILRMPSWDAVLAAAREKKVQIICTAQRTPERDKFLLFTRPFIRIPEIIVTGTAFKGKASMEDLRGKKVVMTQGYALLELIRHQYPWIDIHTVQRDIDGLLEVSFNRVDAMIIGLTKASHLIEARGINNLRMAGQTDIVLNLGFASQKDLPVLHSILEKGLAAISPEERQEIHRKWISLGAGPFYTQMDFWLVLSSAVGVLTVVIFSVLLWNRTLKRQVTRSTEQLKKELREKTLAQTALHQSEERFKMAMDVTRDGLWDWDIVLNEVYYSPAYASMLGYDSTKVPAHVDSWRSLIHPDDKEEAFRENQNCIDNKCDQFKVEFRMQAKNGEWRWIMGRGKAVKRDETGKALRMVGTHTDITEQRMLEEQIMQSRKMESIGTLAGGIAHDFNNILFPILGHTQMLMTDIPQDSSLRPGVDSIYTSALRAKALVEQILTFSRQEKSEIKQMNIQPILKESLYLLRSTIPATINIRREIEPDCRPIKADPTQIHQIIMNLAANASHAMEENGGTMTVVLKEELLSEVTLLGPHLQPGPYACLAIKDTGRGMDNVTAGKIFDPFFTTKEKTRGTGMGLAVVHGIVNKLGGSIRVESRLGRGSAFYIYFPVEESGAEDLTAVQPPPAPEEGNERILLVDDEAGIIEMEQQLLERLGYRVTAHTSSIKALEAFKHRPDRFNLIITDLAMPDMPGDRLAEELLKINPGAKIIICTGFSKKISLESVEAMGVKALFLKPMLMEEIAGKIRKVLDEK